MCTLLDARVLAPYVLQCARSRACAHLGALAWMLCALQGTRTPGHHMCPYWPMWGTRSKVCAPEHVPRRCVRSWACAHLGWACPPGWHAWDACARGSALLGMCASGINTPPWYITSGCELLDAQPWSRFSGRVHPTLFFCRLFQFFNAYRTRYIIFEISLLICDEFRNTLDSFDFGSVIFIAWSFSSYKWIVESFEEP